MRLYDYDQSPSCLKVRLALAELELEFEQLTVNLEERQQCEDSFLKLNPFGTVPVFEDGSVSLRESNAILTYLGREYGHQYWPSEPTQESQAIEWLFVESAQLSLPINMIWRSDVVSPIAGNNAPSPKAVEQCADQLEGILNVLEHHLARQPFVMGSEFTLVDCCYAVSLNLIRGTRLDKRTVWPNLTEYRERACKRDSWRTAKGAAIHQVSR